MLRAPRPPASPTCVPLTTATCWIWTGTGHRAGLGPHPDPVSGGSGDCPAGVKLRLGLELGGAPVDPDCAAAILSGADLDFVIGSIHNLSPAKGGKDFYFLDYTTPRACYEALDDYFDSLAQLVHLDCWDTMGHIIYPLRYMQQIPGHPVTLERYQDRLRALLTGVAQAGGPLR